MKTEIEGLKAEVQKLKTSIAFYASISRSIPMRQLHTHMILKYDRVELNHGNGYNKNSGMFTAPVTGLYMFFVTNNAFDYTTISFNVVKNNVVKNQGISDAISTGARLSVTLATPVPLVSGDTVYVQISYLRAKHAFGMTSDHIHDECSFSGYKIN
ncbi:C1QL [Mytilus edulis]|uniref:C1QL n=1 Tax=Mytilus edulis TaxID=6550 RepID=A0A8S3VC68_MYTED|nr:C1QL [Mytilus edulis]